jgi:hypothetical protein
MNDLFRVVGQENITVFAVQYLYTVLYGTCTRSVVYRLAKAVESYARLVQKVREMRCRRHAEFSSHTKLEVKLGETGETEPCH